MNLLLFDARELAGERLVLDGRRARHLIDVLRVEVGEETVTVAVTLTADSPPPSTIDLAVAMPRPKVLSRVLEHAAACAVRRIDLVNAWRVDKSYLGSSRLDDAKIQLALRIGAEQGMTTHLPALAVHRRLMAWLDGPLPDAVRLIADAGTGLDIERALLPGDGRPVLVVIGPERGWIPRELETFAERGFTAIRLGASILRVEAAVTAALAQISLLRRL